MDHVVQERRDMTDGVASPVEKDDRTQVQRSEQERNDNDSADCPTPSRRPGQRRDPPDDQGGCVARQRGGKNVLPDGADHRGNLKVYWPPRVPERGDRENPERRNT